MTKDLVAQSTSRRLVSWHQRQVGIHHSTRGTSCRVHPARWHQKYHGRRSKTEHHGWGDARDTSLVRYAFSSDVDLLEQLSIANFDVTLTFLMPLYRSPTSNKDIFIQFLHSALITPYTILSFSIVYDSTGIFKHSLAIFFVVSKLSDVHISFPLV